MRYPNRSALATMWYLDGLKADAGLPADAVSHTGLGLVCSEP
jgi:hypothetical protein